MKRILILFCMLSIFAACRSSLDIRQEVAGLDSIQFIFDEYKENENDSNYEENKKSKQPLKILLKDKHHRRNFVNSLAIQNSNINIKNLKKIGTIIFKRMNVKVDLLEGDILIQKNEFYFHCQFNQKKYLRKIEKEGIEILNFIQQFPDAANGLQYK